MQLDTIVQADALTYLQSLPDESVHLIVTSPPYFGLRDYGTAEWEGGDSACDHVQSKKPPTVNSSSTLGYPSDGGPRRIAEGNTYHEAYTTQFSDVCGKCGARRIDQQIGLEATPAAYIARMVDVFREAKRVLRRDGNLFVNLDDSYVGYTGKNYLKTRDRPRDKTMHVPGGHDIGTPHTSNGIPNKSLMAVPERFLIAMIDDGWIARERIVWSKRNPMPESVIDRCTRSFEMVYHFTREPRYWSDMQAVAEPTSGETFKRARRAVSATHKMVNGAPGQTAHTMNQPREYGAGTAVKPKRNLRNVWTISTQGFKGAHFATFPDALVKRIILMACPETTCAACGAGYIHVFDKPDMSERPVRSDDSKFAGDDAHLSNGWGGYPKSAGQAYQDWRDENPDQDMGYVPSCKCGHGKTSNGIVLDPFMGSGTTALMAKRLNRRYLGCDLNAEYVAMAQGRIESISYTLMSLLGGSQTELQGDGKWSDHD